MIGLVEVYTSTCAGILQVCICTATSWCSKQCMWLCAFQSGKYSLL